MIAALRDFNPRYDRCGVKTGKAQNEQMFSCRIAGVLVIRLIQ